MIVEIEAYFKRINESFYKKDIEKSEEHWNECINLERKYVDEKRRIYKINCFPLTGDLPSYVLFVNRWRKQNQNLDISEIRYYLNNMIF